jgi:hypothetical protein
MLSTAANEQLAMAAMKMTMLVSAVMSVFLLSAPCAFAQPAGQHVDPVAQLRTALEQDGFSVHPGMVSTVDWAGMYCKGERPDAGYVNKAPYLMIQVPQSADPSAPVVEYFKLRPDEAIVLIGPTPPPVKYFGFNAFLGTRFYPDEPPGTQRRWLVATLGDAINNATIKTTGPTPFGRPVVVIFTPDRGTDARIRTALQRTGYPPAIVNTMVLPASMLTLGESDTADELTLKMRIGLVEGKPEALAAYVQSAGTNVKVLRVTPATAAIANPFPVPPLRVRGTGQTEMDLMSKVEQLRAGIIAANPGMHATDILSMPVGYEGYDYIQRRTAPGADSRDNVFLAAGYIPQFGSNQRVTLADDEFLVVYGVNHVATGKASYASVNVYASEFAKLSIGQVFHDKFPGTAAPYLPSGDPAASRLYAVKASRNCGGDPSCVPLRVDACPVLTLEDDTALGIFFRMYLEPATRAGAAMQEIIYDRAIKFSPRKD